MEQPKPQRILLAQLRPTEFLVPEDRMGEIGKHYDCTVESIKAISVYADGNGSYLIDNGNKRAVFLHTQGKDEISAIVKEENPQAVAELERLAAKAAKFSGVQSIADLAKRIVPRDDYNYWMGICDRLAGTCDDY